MAAALAAAAVIVAVSGGFRATVGGLRISARSPGSIALLAAAAAFVWYRAASRARAVAADLEDAWSAVARYPSRIIVCIAVVSGMMAAGFATRSAAGADASGYVSEAATFARAQLFHVDDLFELTRGRDPYLTSPLGWRPAPIAARQVPTYAPGLPLLMSIPHAVAGIDGAAAVVIASTMVAVGATGSVALQMGGAAAGVMAACLLAFLPIFLHQSIQLMSDVPVTAAWLACFALLVRRRSLAAGVACAAAVMIRPNLAPLAIVPLIIADRRVRFTLPVAGAGVVVAILQWLWYGSPLRSGYGATEELFALSHVAANARHYSQWLLETAPVLVVALVGMWRARSGRTAQALAGFAALVIAAYLIYAVFDDWSYLRFVLPALAAFAVFVAIAVSDWLARWPMRVRAPLLFAMLLVVVAQGIAVARSHGTFALAGQLRRVSQVAGYINANAPAGAVLIAGEQSGSMRYYTRRAIVRWEAASPEALAASVTALRRDSRPVYVVLDAWEDEPFRAKTGGAVPLDWPPALEAGTSHRTRVWTLADGERFHRGERIETLRVP